MHSIPRRIQKATIPSKTVILNPTFLVCAEYTIGINEIVTKKSARPVKYDLVTKLSDEDEYEGEADNEEKEDNDDEEEDEIWNSIKDLSEEELAEEEADIHEAHGIMWEEMWEEYRARAKQGHVIEIILKVIRPRSFLKAPSGKAVFKVELVDSSEVILSVGKRMWQIRIPAECWDGIPNFLANKGWVLIGAKHDQPSREGSVDEYVKRFTHGVSAASYVVPILERIYLVEVDRREPNRIRLIDC